MVYVAGAGKFAYHMDSTVRGLGDGGGSTPCRHVHECGPDSHPAGQALPAGDAVYTGTEGRLRLLSYRHEVMSGDAYEALPDQDENTLYLIYEED